MKNRPMDSSASTTTEVTAVYTVSFTDGCSNPEQVMGSCSSLPEALQEADDYMKDFKKDLKEQGCEVPEDAQCFIYMRVCGTKGTTTQTVHLIS